MYIVNCKFRSFCENFIFGNRAKRHVFGNYTERHICEVDHDLCTVGFIFAIAKFLKKKKNLAKVSEFTVL